MRRRIVSLRLFAPPKSAVAAASLEVLKLISALACRSTVGNATKRPMTFCLVYSRWLDLGASEHGRNHALNGFLTHKVPAGSPRFPICVNHPFISSDLGSERGSGGIVRCICSADGLTLELDEGIELFTGMSMSTFSLHGHHVWEYLPCPFRSCRCTECRHVAEMSHPHGYHPELARSPTRFRQHSSTEALGLWEYEIKAQVAYCVPLSHSLLDQRRPAEWSRCSCTVPGSPSFASQAPSRRPEMSVILPTAV